MTTGERIRDKRESIGLTQQDLADKMGYKNKSIISKLEHDDRDISLKSVKKAAAALNCTPEYLLGWEEACENKGMNLYEKIKRLRKENGWSQQDMADKMEYTNKSMISQIENGKIDLPRSRIEQFANVFHVDPVELMGNGDLNAKPYMRELERIIEELPENRKEDLLKIAKMYYEEVKN